VAKFSFSYDGDSVVIMNEQSKKLDDKLTLVKHVELSVAFRTLTRGRQADEKASDVAISMLAQLLDDSAILSEYKGKTPANEKVDSRFNAAMRDAENDIFKRAFVDAHISKGATAAKADQLWQDFRKSELSTGSYSNAKSFVAKLWCHAGLSPVAPNGDLLPLHAIRRMYESWKDGQDNIGGKKTISARLQALRDELENSPSEETIGELATAIASLKWMLATCETLYSGQRERMTELTGNPSLTEQSAKVIGKAQRVKASQPVAEDAPV
jgi:hypothetical protein